MFSPAGRNAAAQPRWGEGVTAKEGEPMPASEGKVTAAPGRDRERVFDSRILFGQSREIRITHNGESYSLRVTRLGKLILTK